MSRIRALRESINDRFSVLSFSVRADQPLYEIGLATDPALFQRDQQARRTRGNFFASPQLSRTPTSTGESVYLVPPNVVARFVGQPRLYFGLATYSDTDRSRPITVRTPDRGTMYVDLAGLTERGLRRTARGASVNGDATGYGTAAPVLSWGGDAALPTVNGKGANGHVATPRNSASSAHVDASTSTPPTYSDGYSDDLWDEPAAAAAGPATPEQGTGVTAAVPASEAPATAQSVRGRNGHTALGNGYANGGGQAKGRPHQNGYAHPAGHAGPPARSQSRGRAEARELRVVSSYYNPSDWLDALRTQIGFFAAGVQWWAGVENTTVAPHCAICQARTVDGSDEGGQHGSAFFIAPNLLLTAAHVVRDQSALIIVPGKNGAGTAGANEPFGRFRVAAGDMVMHPSYVRGNSDFDMALIRVPASNASPNYFDLVEELTQSRPEGVVVCGYAAYSDPQDAIDSVVNATIDADRQHAHGGYIRSLPSEETFDYDLQSLGGTSGSPVYYIEHGDAPRTHMVGVHVAGHSDTTNLGCRITPAKLAWIRQQAAAWGQSLSFSLGARALSDAPADAMETADSGGGSGYDESEEHGADEHSAEPQESEASAQAMAHDRSARAHALTAQEPDYPGATRFVAAHANNFRRGRRRGTVVDRIVVHITAGGPNINGTISWFQNGNRVNESTGKPIRTSAHYIVGRDGEVVQMVRNADTAHHASNANARSIGIEHNANKPSRRNERDLPPTMEQYQASAHLVAWLCAQHGLPIDRTHIVGHAEADHVTNHDCPSSYWDWDTYMQCVQLAADALANNSSTGAVPATSQSLHTGAPVRAHELITPYYDPSNPASALQCTHDAFSQQREEWFVGVDSTGAFPHSAICHISMVDTLGDTYTGTGFYIGPNRILTCAHNLHQMVSATVTPARNGSGDAPFGQFHLTASQWRVANGYAGDGDWDRDLAVIDNTEIAAPNGAYFRFMHATPGGTMPLAVCGYSAGSRLVRELNPLIDRNKQHLHGGHAQGQATFDTIDYDILAIAGASGSPVYTVRDEGNGLEAFVCGVHVTRGPIESSGAPRVNRACFITPTKIDWIEGRATAFAYRGPRALSTDGVEHDVRLIPQPDKNACWAASMAMLLGFRGAASVDPEALAREVGGSLSTSYDWDLLTRVSARHGFVAIEQPSNASLYHAPTQWAQWLRDKGPLWVVIVGAPHAVVLAGIRGDLANPASVEVRVLNPWDTRVAFDNDEVAFHPPNHGQDSWIAFEQFASDFGNVAEPDYGNWRVLYLPATVAPAATAQSFNGRGLQLKPAPPSRSMSVSPVDQAIESRVPGMQMHVVRGSAGACKWTLEQALGTRPPAHPSFTVPLPPDQEVTVEIDDWPAVQGDASPLPLRVRFKALAGGGVGNVVIEPGSQVFLAYGVEVHARIDDDVDTNGVAALKVTIDYAFTGEASSAPTARVHLRLFGNGLHERSNQWLDAAQQAA